MIYRLAILSRESEDFRMEVEIAPQASFLDLNNLITAKLGYSPEEITMFHVCDEEWEPVASVSLIEMDSDPEHDSYTMENTRLEQFLRDEGDKMIFEFDILNGRGLYISLREVKTGSLPGDEARCTKLRGTVPRQIEMDSFLEASKPEAAKKPAQPADSMDEEFYGTEGYNEDEFDQEGFSELDTDQIDL